MNKPCDHFTRKHLFQLYCSNCGKPEEEHTRDFPVPTSSLHHKEDPWTSKESARKIRHTKRLGQLQVEALKYVQGNPGATAYEMAELSGWKVTHEDKQKIARRLSELATAEKVHSNGWKMDPSTNRRCLRWWPGPKVKAEVG